MNLDINLQIQYIDNIFNKPIFPVLGGFLVWFIFILLFIFIADLELIENMEKFALRAISRYFRHLHDGRRYSGRR